MIKQSDRVTLQHDCGDHPKGETGTVVAIKACHCGQWPHAPSCPKEPVYTILWDGHPKPDSGWQGHWFNNKD